MASLIPRTAPPAMRAAEAVTEHITVLPVEIAKAKTPQTVPASHAAWLAWEYSVDEWDAGWSLTQQRLAIMAAPAIHRLKGTVGALKRAFAALGTSGTIQEWHQYAGQPYRFRCLVNLNVETLTVEDMKRITRVCLATKNVRSFFEGFTAVRDVPGEIIVGAGLYSEVRATFRPLEIFVPEFPAPVFVGAAYAQRVHTRLFPVLP